MRKISSRIFAFTAAAAVAAFFSATGCATAVDKTEVEQKANPVKELHAELQEKQAAEEEALKWYSYEEATVKARQEGKVIMVDFYAKWCHWCKELDKKTYTDRTVIDALKAGFIPVKVDAESGEKTVYEMQQVTMSELADKYEVRSYPAIWFIDKDGNKAKLLNGYLGPKEFLLYLNYIKAGSYKTMEFEEFVAKGGATN
ncbi:MAG: thioredoxin fold domain-containing protein [Nitrospirae bacterium]|nr:thioredoxin fold domain-containing protein [Nitrospirota bacterium]MBI5695285.1 thioredoxin fold domain-containing protein [Nitrospirota bacterium]